MTTADTENELDYAATPFYRQMVMQLRALDSYGSYDNWSDEKVLAPMILNKNRKRDIPIIGDPDEIVISRIKAYYNALAASIEKATGKMAVPIISLSHEGFGRAIILVGKLVVVDKTLRDAHRFGFSSIARLCDNSTRVIDQAVSLTKQFADAATA